MFRAYLSLISLGYVREYIYLYNYIHNLPTDISLAVAVSATAAVVKSTSLFSKDGKLPNDEIGKVREEFNKIMLVISTTTTEPKRELASVFEMVERGEI